MEGRSLWGETESPEQTGKKTSLFLRCALQTQRGGEQEAQRWHIKWWAGEGIQGLLAFLSSGGLGVQPQIPADKLAAWCEPQSLQVDYLVLPCRSVAGLSE